VAGGVLVDWKSRHREAFQDARHICRLDSIGQAMIVIIVAITCISVIWLGAGGGEAWTETLAKAGSTLGILLIFPIVYLTKLLRAGPWAERNARMLLIVGLSGVIFFACLALAGAVLQSKATGASPEALAKIEAVAAQVDRLGRIAFIRNTQQRFDQLVEQLPAAANSFKRTLTNPGPMQTTQKTQWTNAVQELEALYKGYSGKEINLRQHPRFDKNWQQKVTGEDAVQGDAGKLDFRRFADQLLFAEQAIPKAQAEMREELKQLEAQAYQTRLGSTQ
jgi:hypothetical protein